MRALARSSRTPLLAAMLLSLAAAPAGAGSYTVGYDFVYNAGYYPGWYVQSNVSGKSHMCGLNQNDCSGRTVLGQSTAGVGAWTTGVALGAGNLARVAFVPPPSTVLTAMTVDMQRVVENNSYMRVQIGGKPDGYDWGGFVQQSIADSTIDRATYSHSGNMATGYYVQLINTSSATQTPNVRNGFSIKAATATLFDGTAPTVEQIVGFGTGWYTGANACTTVRTTDAGGGVTAVALLVDGGNAGTVPKGSGNPYVPGLTAADDTQLCVLTSNLSDGDHAARAVAYDAGGNPTNGPDSTIKVDNSPPVLGSSGAPAAASDDRRPVITVNAADPHSGLAGPPTATLQSLSVAGQPSEPAPLVAGAAGSWSWQPPADGSLPDGQYKLVYSATNVAGGIATGNVTFEIKDTTAPAVTSILPGAGSSVGPDTTASFTVADTGGVLAEGIVVKLDGTVVNGSFADGAWSGAIAGLSQGAHELEITVTDRSGNATNVKRSFTSTGPPPGQSGNQSPTTTILPGINSFTPGTNTIVPGSNTLTRLIQGNATISLKAAGRRRHRVKALRVAGTKGARIVIACVKIRCKARTLTGKGVDRDIAVKGAARRILRPGQGFRITITRPGFIGQRITLTATKKLGRKRTTKCLAAGTGKVVVCP